MTFQAAPALHDDLDAELARWLRLRTSLRAASRREGSSLDDMAFALRRVRATLALLGSAAGADDAALGALVARGYRWAIRIARELYVIEQMRLDAMTEWTRFEAFAPFALAFFDTVVGSAFAPFASKGQTAEVARMRREMDAVLAPLITALRSSAMAA